MNDADWLWGLFTRTWAKTLPWRTVYNADGELVAIATRQGASYEVTADRDADAFELAVGAVNQLPAVFAVLGAAVCPACHTRDGLVEGAAACQGEYHAVVSLIEHRGRGRSVPVGDSPEPVGFEAYMDGAHPFWRDPRINREYIDTIRAAYAGGRASRDQEVLAAAGRFDRLRALTAASRTWQNLDAAAREVERLEAERASIEGLLAEDRTNLRPGLTPTLVEMVQLALELRGDAVDQAWAHVRALEAEAVRERQEWANRLAARAPAGALRLTVEGAALRTGTHATFVVYPGGVDPEDQRAGRVPLESFSPTGSVLRRLLDVALEDAAMYAQATRAAG